MKYNGFYFLIFRGTMKKVLTEKYDRTYAADIINKSKKVYRKVVADAGDRRQVL